jgi:WD40 repeat protein
MSSIFISHSSKDNAIANEIKERLQEEGYRAIFLDFDHKLGILAGSDWEKKLYTEIKSCQAFIILCSPNSMASPWCFAEITLAKAECKHIFSIKISDCNVVGIINSTHSINWSDSKAYERLRMGLEGVGLDPNDPFDWDKSRPPFPGLLSFEAEDAAIFFGRDKEISHGLYKLRTLPTLGGTRLLLVLGASGSGKSSFVRAGLLPHLKRDPHSWIVVAPFRPRKDPFEEFSSVLANCFQGYGSTKDSKLIYEQFIQSYQEEATLIKVFEEIIAELRNLANRKQATLLLVIDQVEELLTHRDINSQVLASQFLCLMRSIATSDIPIIIIGTLRSDYLGIFQKHPALKAFDFANLTLSQMGVDQIAQTIQGPARIANLDVTDPGLVPALLDDAKTDNALPLLAFTLRELWERCGKDDLKLTLEEYRSQIGGLEGAVRQAATAVLEAYISRKPDKREEIEVKLREAFLKMVRVSEEGRYTRRVAKRSGMPPEIDDLLTQFVNARLLVPDEESGFIEVRHEVLLTAWPLLRAWLQEDQEFLLWQRSLESEIQAWEQNQRDKSAYLRGTLLAKAEDWLHKRSDLLSPLEQEFIQLSQQFRDNKKKEKEKEKESQRQKELQNSQNLLKAEEGARKEAEKSLQKTKLLSWSIFIFSIVVFALSLFFQRKVLLENVQTTSSESLARSKSGQDLEAIIVALKASQIIQNPLLKVFHGRTQEKQLRQTLLTVLNSAHEINQLRGHTGRVKSVSVSPNREYIATAGYDGDARLWTIDGRLLGSCSEKNSEDVSVMSVRFSPNSKYFAAGQANGTLILCPTQKSEKPLVVKEKAHNGGGESILSINFLEKPPINLSNVSQNDVNGKIKCGNVSLADKNLIATTGTDGHAKLWKFSNNQLSLICDFDLSHNRNLKAIYDLDFSPDYNHLVTAGRAITIWNLQNKNSKVISLNKEDGGINYSTSAELSPDGKLIASLGGKKPLIKVWQLNSLQEPSPVIEFRGSKALVNSLSFYSGKTQPEKEPEILAVGDDGISRLWNLDGSLESSFGTAQEALYSAVFIPASPWFMTSGDRGTPRIWNSTGNTLLSTNKSVGGIKSISFNRSTKILSTAQCEGNGTECQGSLRLWDINGKHLSERLKAYSGHIWSVSQSANGKFLATAGKEGIKIWSLPTLSSSKKISDNFISIKHLGATSVDFNFKNDQQIVSGGKDGKVYLWNLQKNTKTEIFDYKTLEPNGLILGVKFSLDGQKVVAVGGGKRDKEYFGVVVVVDIKHGKTLFQSETDDFVTAMAFSSNSHSLAAAGNDKKVRIWDLKKQEKIREFSSGTRPITSLVFSNNNSEVITAGYDQNIRISDLNGEELASFKGNQDYLYSMDFLSSNKGADLLATAGHDGTVKVWHVGDLDELVQQGCKWVWNYLDNYKSNLPKQEKEVYQYCKSFNISKP